MIEIIAQSKELFEATNKTISFKFYKSGENQGYFDIKYKKEVENSLINCYSAINFFSAESDVLSEFSSKNYSFSNRVESIEEIFGKGIKVIFSFVDAQNQNICFDISFKIYDNHEFVLIKLINIKEKNKNSLKVHSIAPLTINDNNLWLSGPNNPTNLSTITWFKHGFQGWSPCEILFGDEVDDKGPSLEILNMVYDNQDYTIEGRFYSEYFTVISDLESKNSLIIGFVTFKDQFSRIILDYKEPDKMDLLTAFGCMDGVKLQESSINSSEELFISFKSNNCGYYGLIDYAKVVKAKIQEKRITDVPVGWCSWYYYYEDISEEALVKNLEYFKNNRDILPIDFIQLDDGYFTEIGDFSEINSKFPNGLYGVFNEIKNSGFKGGIWTAPFFAVRKSHLFKEYKNWFLKNVESKKLLKTAWNWNSFLFSLDLSDEVVIDYLKQFYKRLLFAFENKNLNKPIIEFFKIDFLHAGVPIKGDYKKKSLTRAQLYRNGIKAIREAITDQSFLLGCGAPLGPCVGLVDAMRISYDTAPHWEAEFLEKREDRRGISLPALKVALLNILYRSFMHKYFWINDPDCLMIRRTDTKLNIDEIRLQLTIFGLSGGQVLISDDMTKLSNNEIKDAKLVIPPYNPKEFDPILVDAFTSRLPSIYTLETTEIIGKRYLVCLINWDDEIITKSTSISEMIPNLQDDNELFYIYDFWNKRFLGKFNRSAVIELNDFNPHSCCYLNVIPVSTVSNDSPIFLSSDLHISQGCHEIRGFEYKKGKEKIQIELSLIGKREGFFYIKLPKSKTVVNYKFKSSRVDIEENIWELFVEFENKISLEIELANNT